MLFIVFTIVSERCNLSNQGSNNDGYCIPFKDCDESSRFEEMLHKETFQNVLENFAACTYITHIAGSKKYCCNHDSSKEMTTTMQSLKNHKNYPLFNTSSCGISTSLRIAFGKNTTINQYPWIALLNYKINDNETFMCGGSLISSRYVRSFSNDVVGKFIYARLFIFKDPDCSSLFIQPSRCSKTVG